MKLLRILRLLILSLFIFVSCGEYTEIEKAQENGKVHIISVGINYLSHEENQAAMPVYWSIGKQLVAENGNQARAWFLEICPVDAADVADWLYQIYANKKIKCEEKVLIYEECDTSGYTESLNKRMSKYADSLSGAEIIDTISGLEVNSNDLIIFYFSGHGACINDVPYLATLGKYGEGEGKVKAVLTPTSEIIKALEAKGCRSVVILDCCENGAEFADAESSVSMFESLYKEINTEKVSVLASSSIEQESMSGNEHSLFTAYLLEELGYDDKEVPSSLSIRQLYNRINRAGKDDWEYYHQNPEISFNQLDTVLIPR